MSETPSDTPRRASGVGLATVNEAGATLSVWYPAPHLGEDPEADASATALVTPAARHDPTTGVRYRVARVDVDLDAAPGSAADAYLRLHLLSHRLVAPNTINLDGIFGVLPNVVWTSFGPFAPDDFERVRARLLASGRGPVTVTSIDKFPRMVDFVVPSGVRIGDAERVRLGAHLAPGTTVMHEGFVNYNAGTLGTSMVEGRISQGVVVGDGSDIGGGASIMGTLSGGGKHRISIGRGSLLGANSGLGISLGDNCTIEAGLYVTAGTKVTLLDRLHNPTKTVKAAELSGDDDLLFRRNSQSGAVEVLHRPPASVQLNEALHKQ